MKKPLEKTGTKFRYRYHFFYLLFLLLLITSCKKTTSSGSQSTGTSSYLSSIKTYSPQTQLIDSFSYNSNFTLARFSQYDYDTTTGSPIVDSQVVIFSFGPNATMPTSYILSDIPEGIISDLHQLFFDGQDRITKDTSLSGSGFVTYYSYPANEVVSTVLFEGNFSDNQIDTAFISNGNVGSEHIYYPNMEGTADSLNAAPQFGFSAYVNPAYNPAVSKTIAPLLFILTTDGFGGFTDYLSKNLVNSITGLGNGLPANTTINFTTTADNKGRVIQLSVDLGPVESSTIVFSYF